jgi:hypothetical protein
MGCGDGWDRLDGDEWKRWVVRMDGMDQDGMVGWKGGLVSWDWGTGTGQVGGWV